MEAAAGAVPVGDQGELSLAGIVAGLMDVDRLPATEALVRDALACGMQAWTGDAGVERAIAGGFTARQAQRLRLCAELATCLDSESWAMPAPITGPADVLAQVADIRASKQERVVAIYLDSRNRPLHRELVALGGLRASVIQPRDILAPALRWPAAAIVLVHNHPSGDTTPSREDLEVTRQLVAAAKLLGLELLDHLVVSRTRCSSLRELGHL
ncbi:MAG TPA: JAB domain-containing protein [Candidatus Dormibacteraeota bacterium]|nr:JAB domain-containing protein [Candidatus Dormibacteraeota bacterium]